MCSEKIIVKTVGELINILSEFNHDQPLGKPVAIEHLLIQNRFQTVKVYEETT